MSYVQRQVVDVTTDGDGNATAYTEVVSGHIEAIRYVKDGSTPYTDGVDATITAEGSGQAIVTLTNMNATVTTYPRAATNDVAGAAALYAAGGAAVNDRIPVAAERVKIVLASGGATKTGRFHVYIS